MFFFLIGKTDADVCDQYIDGVKFENLVDVVGGLIAHFPRKIKHYDRSSFAGIGINSKPFNL